MTFNRKADDLGASEKITLTIGSGEHVPTITIDANIPHGFTCAPGETCYKNEKYTLDGVEGLKISHLTNDLVAYEFWDTRKVTIYFSNKEGSEDLFNTFLSTFKFLD